MSRLLFLMTILAAVFVLSNCNNTRRLTSQTEVLFRDKWKLTEVQGEQVPDTVRSSFAFTPGKITGSTGCSFLSAGFTPGKNQTIRFVPDAPLKKCENETAADLEIKFMEALLQSTKWELKGSELWLGDGEKTLIKLQSL